MARRYYRIRDARRRRDGDADGGALVGRDYDATRAGRRLDDRLRRRADGSHRPRLAAAASDARRRRGGRRRPSTPRTSRPRGRRRTSARRGARERRWPSASRRPGGRRSAWSSRRRRARRAAAACQPIDTAPSAPAADGDLVEDDALRGLHPMMAERLRPVAARRVRARRGCPSRRGRLPLPRRRPREPEGRAAVRARRGARPHARPRRARAACVALPQLERMLVEALEAIRARSRPAARRAQRLLWNRVLLHVWPPSTAPPTSCGAAASQRWRRADRGPRASRWSCCRGRACATATASCASASCGSSAPTGRAASSSRSTTRRRADRSRSTSTRRRVVQTRRRGAVYPFELIRLLTPRAGRATRGLPAGDFVEHDLDDDGRLVPVRPPARPEHRQPRRRRRSATVTERYPEGMRRVVAARRPHAARWARWPSRSAGGSSPRSTWPSELGVPRRVVRAVGRRPHRDGQRHREHGLDRRGAAPHHRVHPGRRRDQRRRHRHQRRRAAVLERRGDDAHAHPRHPGHDARERDGAHRQAGARLLGRRVGRGQPRHRRLRADHGPERPGAVLGAGPGRRLRAPARATTSTPTWCPGERFPRRAATTDPLDRDVRSSPHHRRRAATSRRSATSSRDEPTPGARSRSTSAR